MTGAKGRLLKWCPINYHAPKEKIKYMNGGGGALIATLS